MANNLVEYLAQLKTKDPNRANWFFDCADVGTNDWGFGKVKQCREIIAGSHVKYDFKSAYSTNATISPVLGRAKVHVTAWWIPTRLYVPALRDGVEVKAGKTDYAFPTINFNFDTIRSIWIESENSDVRKFGVALPYIPANSIYSDLRMWAPYYQPIGNTYLVAPHQDPKGKNAIPLLGYYDIFRNYIMNTQSPDAPIRTRGFSRRFVDYSADGNLNGNGRLPSFVDQSPVDIYVTRTSFDNLFKDVRNRLSDYQIQDGVDISDLFAGKWSLFPYKSAVHLINEDGTTDANKIEAFNDNHFGEWRATYHPDYFTAYLSNENVEYERSTARVQADDGGFITMEQVYSAQRVQNYIRRTVFKNSDYAEFINSQYGVTPSTSITKPMFMGSMSTWLTFNDVVAQAQTSDDDTIDSNSTLGSRASLGFGRMITGKLRDKKDRHFVEFTAKEPGYFMVIEYIVPEVHYWQGYDPMYDKLSLESLYYPAFDKDGYQDKQFRYLCQQYSGQGLNGLPAGSPINEYNISYAQEPAWWEYMANYPTLSGQMVEEGVYRHWCFTRDIVPSYFGNSSNSPVAGFMRLNTTETAHTALNTYVEPEQFNSIFANINGLDNIQTYYRHELKIYQPLSHRFLSY